MPPAALTEADQNQEAGVQPACASCNAPLAGPFCSQCGEQVIDRESLTLWHFLSHSLLHELTEVDGKVFRTVRCLFFRPGFLAEEYFAGRRRAYINPVRLLLTAVVLFALLNQGMEASLTLTSFPQLRLNMMPPGPPRGKTVEDTIKKLDVLGVLSRQLERAGKTKDVKSEAAAERFHHELKTYGTALSFGNVILLAGLLFVMFRRRRGLFVEHVIFSLHFACFVLLFTLITSCLFRLLSISGNQPVALIAGSLLILPVLVIPVLYLHRALFRFYYPERYRKVKWWSGTAWLVKLAVLVVFLGNSVFITVVYAAGAAIALSRL